jgi:hypothetical protein
MKKKIKTFSFLEKEPAVSEIVGTLILIVIAVSTFSAISIIILSPWLTFQTLIRLMFSGRVYPKTGPSRTPWWTPLDTTTQITITIDGLQIHSIWMISIIGSIKQRRSLDGW